MYIIGDVIIPYILQNKIVLTIYTILTIIVYIVSSIIIPRGISEFLNATMHKHDKMGVNILSSIKRKSSMGFLYIIGGSFLFYGISHFIKTVVQSNILMDFSFYSKKQIIENIFKMLTNNYKELPESEIQWIINQISASSRQITKYLFEFVIPFFIIFMVISCYIYYYSIQIFYVFIIQNALLLVTNIVYHEALLTKWSRSDQTTITNNNYINDKLKNLLNIIFDNSVNEEIAKIQQKEIQLYTDTTDAVSLQNGVLLVTNTVIYGLFFVILYMIMKNRSLSHIVIILLLFKGFQETFITETIYQYFAYSKVIKINNILQNLTTETDCKTIGKFYGIKLNNVSYRYSDKSSYILRNLTIEFKPKQFNVIMGKSGSGKTTIMKLIIKMYNPTNGSIYMDDTDIESICQHDVRKRIYYVNQRTILFEESILYNLQYGNNTPKEKIEELLNTYDLLEYYQTLENGIETNAGVNGSNLSMGMQKIIMVVRGVLKPGKCIIIYDEPLTSLDKETREKIVKLMVNESKNKTIIVISHDPEILPHADNIIRLS